MFLHTMTFKANSTELLASMDKFLVICDGLNITAGFVFFDVSSIDQASGR
jgi:hypothetical protein